MITVQQKTHEKRVKYKYKCRLLWNSRRAKLEFTAWKLSNLDIIQSITGHAWQSNS